MAVTLTVADLLAALRMGESDEETAERDPAARLRHLGDHEARASRSGSGAK